MYSRPKSNTTETLARAVATCSEKRRVFGVVLDATGHYKTDESYDYVTRLKIIDKTFNNLVRPGRNEVEPFVYVFIYSPNVELAPQIGRIGDIIRLDRFKFDVFDKKVKAVFHRKTSHWSLFDGRQNANALPILQSANGPGSPLLESDRRLLKKMRKWASEFFESRSLYKMSWLKRPIPKGIGKRNICELKDVDIIAKLLADISVKKDNDFYQRLVFVDKDKRIYLGELKGLLTGVDKGDVLKLRSITITAVGGTYKVGFSSYSNFMVLQKNFHDARELLSITKNITYDEEKLKKEFFQDLHLDKRDKEMIGPNTFIYSSDIKRTDQFDVVSQKNLQTVFPILKNFTFDVSSLNPMPKNRRFKRKSRNKKMILGSIVLSKHQNLKIKTLKQMEEILAKARDKRTPSKGKKQDLENYRVRVKIQGVEHQDFDLNFRLYSQERNRTWKLSGKLPKNLPDDTKVIFYNVFNLWDSSLASDSQKVPAYLITYNENPKYIFDLWRLLPDPLVVSDWTKLSQERKDKFRKCLKRLSKENKYFDFILQIAKADKGRTYLKIVDSMFWLAAQE